MLRLVADLLADPVGRTLLPGPRGGTVFGGTPQAGNCPNRLRLEFLNGAADLIYARVEFAQISADFYPKFANRCHAFIITDLNVFLSNAGWRESNAQ